MAKQKAQNVLDILCDDIDFEMLASAALVRVMAEWLYDPVYELSKLDKSEINNIKTEFEKLQKELGKEIDFSKLSEAEQERVKEVLGGVFDFKKYDNSIYKELIDSLPDEGKDKKNTTRDYYYHLVNSLVREVGTTVVEPEQDDENPQDDETESEQQKREQRITRELLGIIQTLIIDTSSRRGFDTHKSNFKENFATKTGVYEKEWLEYSDELWIKAADSICRSGRVIEVPKGKGELKHSFVDLRKPPKCSVELSSAKVSKIVKKLRKIQKENRQRRVLVAKFKNQYKYALRVEIKKMLKEYYKSINKAAGKLNTDIQLENALLELWEQNHQMMISEMQRIRQVALEQTFHITVVDYVSKLGNAMFSSNQRSKSVEETWLDKRSDIDELDIASYDKVFDEENAKTLKEIYLSGNNEEFNKVIKQIMDEINGQKNNDNRKKRIEDVVIESILSERGETQKKTAERLGISEKSVSEIIKKFKMKLGEHFEKSGMLKNINEDGTAKSTSD